MGDSPLAQLANDEVAMAERPLTANTTGAAARPARNKRLRPTPAKTGAEPTFSA